MTEWMKTSRYRYRPHIVDGAVLLVLQVEERDGRGRFPPFAYRWRDADVQDLPVMGVLK